MSEPSGVVVAGALGVGAAGLLSGIDGNAATGALCGAMIFFMTRREFPLAERAAYFLISLVMGYLLSPGLAEVQIGGIRPFVYSGPAAFGASLMVVTLSRAALRKRARADDGGETDG